MENRPLVTEEPVEFDKNHSRFKTFLKTPNILEEFGEYTSK
jgi:hypothetical protein